MRKFGLQFGSRCVDGKTFAIGIGSLQNFLYERVHIEVHFVRRYGYLAFLYHGFQRLAAGLFAQIEGVAQHEQTGLLGKGQKIGVVVRVDGIGVVGQLKSIGHTGVGQLEMVAGLNGGGVYLQLVDRQQLLHVGLF